MSFNGAMWPSNPSSGSGGMEGSMGYFTSPLGTGTLNSFAGSTSASPPGPGQEWAATMTPMDTTYGMGSSGSHSMVEGHAPGLDAGGFFASESFDTVPHMSVVEGNNQHTLPGSAIRATGKAVVQHHTDERFKADTSGRRKSSSSSTRKKDKKRKPSSGQDGQPPPVQGPKLRTAARRRASETGNLPKPGESPEDQRARTSHNKVEKEYRNRLNREFELVIDVLPANQALPGQSSRGKMSKADVIGNATATIQSLADEVLQLREKKRQKEEEKKKKKKKLPKNDQPA
ncbi:hypothetical protein QBC37DRAFT_36164 [Rhypophila decipiens]|uniref:BHLH domain-containing protein n=1 Tax=Rhypophila decipiens TaxID=261697 RepID=A0AAN6Y306_9PEZI|nr:hypothetical protein QBC37DRAFT_36164 [Rhypophila decipiens]